MLTTLAACGGAGGGTPALPFEDGNPPPAPSSGTGVPSATGEVQPEPTTTSTAPPPALPEDDILARPSAPERNESRTNWFPGEPNLTPPPLPGEDDPAAIAGEIPGHQGLGGGPPQPVPEPEEVLLFLMGAATLLIVLWRNGIFARSEVADGA